MLIERSKEINISMIIRVCEQDGLLSVLQNPWKDRKKYGLHCNDCGSIAPGIKNVIVFMC